MLTGTVVLKLTGHLDGSEECRHQCAELLCFRNLGQAFEVDASDLTIEPDGVEIWEEAVTKFCRHLSKPCKITYKNSQLAMVLYFDPDFDRSNAEFEEADWKTE